MILRIRASDGFLIVQGFYFFKYLYFVAFKDKQMIINKNSDICFLFSLVDSRPITFCIKGTPRGFDIYNQN